MKKLLNIGILALLGFSMMCCGEQQIKNIESRERTIEVRGSADMSVVPDEIELSMEIQAYGAERVEKIEERLMAKLAELGVAAKDVKTNDVGDYWHYPYDSYRIRKQLSVIVKDLANVEKVVNAANMQGLNYIRISDMRNSNIQEHRKQVKANALKAAKMKATYLLETMDKSLGEVISIKESNENTGNENPYYWWYGRQQNTQVSNMSVSAGQPNNAEGGGFKEIRLYYEMEVVFEIE